MNRLFYVSILAFLLLPEFLIAQYQPGLPANFGIDGDVLSGQAQNISNVSSAGSFDWFKKPGSGPNVGFGILDTSGNSVLGPQIASGKNIVISKGMTYSRYSAVNGYLLLDARYLRDNFGLSNSSGNSDLSTFTSGSKNGDNPSSWITTPGGSTVSDKADIIDVYAHMRRNGTVINNTNPSALILAMGISTVGNTGNRFIDFELFRSRIDYNSVSGSFTNSGPVISGGHSAWDFNLDGTIREIGDISVAFNAGTQGVTDIAVYIWVSQLTYNTVNPLRFSFVANEFYGSTFGYARIVPKAAPSFQAWASVSSASTAGPDWGTNSKSVSSVGSPGNYYSKNYGANDFVEAAIDLTSLGVDPALAVGMDPCTPPFTRIMAKTRSSASFTSALQDFIGPAEFLDAPTAPAQILNPGPLRCNRTSVTLSPVTLVSGAVYNWSTSNGNILTNPAAPSITVNKAGKYYLTSSIVSGCPANRDSVVINTDYFQPVATATTIGVVNESDPLSTASINGGDVAASNFNTPYGGSAGLSWNWSGPDGYSSTARNNHVRTPGTYTLVLTEQRNGCKDTAFTPVFSINGTLPVKITEFAAQKKEEGKVLVSWRTEDINPHIVEIQRGSNSLEFSSLYIHSENNWLPSTTNLYYDDANDRKSDVLYYRLKITEQSGEVSYSKIITVTFASTLNEGLKLAPNPVHSFTVLTFHSPEPSYGQFQVLSPTGKTIRNQAIRTLKGLNQVTIGDLDKLPKGIYLIRLILSDLYYTEKLFRN